MITNMMSLDIDTDCVLKYHCAFPYRDGVPPYRYRKPHRREIHESAKVNGRVPLPHIPVSMLWIVDFITRCVCVCAFL